MKFENVPANFVGQPADASESSMGHMLVESGKLTPGDAERVAALQAQKGLRFGEAAVTLGLVTDADIREVLASQFNYQYVRSTQSNLDTRLVAAFDPFGEEAESLRALRSQLAADWLSETNKTLAIIAVDDTVGADVMAANLAIVFAQQGQRTVLVDANMRTPRQHGLFHVSAKTGLSDALAGRTKSPEVIGVAGFNTLALLGAGPQPPNPQELLAQPSFKALNESFVRDFDVVLYDAPAFSSNADAYAVATLARGVLLVIRKGKTRQADLREVRAQLLRRGVQIVGSIIIDF